MLPLNVSSIIIDTGNLITSKELKRNAMQSPTEEVFDSTCSTFQSWFSKIENAADVSNPVCCVSSNHIKVEKADRLDLKISVKIFLGSYNPQDLNVAVCQVMDSLNVQVIDSLILALPPVEVFSLEVLKPLWKELEKFVQAGKVATIGISDLEAPELAQLYQWTQVKPSVNQVNLESCCVMPPEMTAFAKDNDIQLLTHNDPKVILPKPMLQNILTSAVPSADEWEVSSIARYSVVVKCRGILQNKGYLMHLVKSS